jgi:hypothetical protein
VRIYLSARQTGLFVKVQEFLDSPQPLPFTGIIYIRASTALFRSHGV